MGLLNRAFVCLLILIPLANSELNSRKSPRDVNLISGKITSFSGAGQHDLRANIPGEPGVDYPIYSSPPDTSFSCFNRHEGYYADVETRCQVFRICSHTDHTGKGFAFLCPNGTLFSQHDFVCDWYKNVPCESSPNFYFMNELLDKSVSKQPDLLMKDVVKMVNYPIKVMKQQQQQGYTPVVSHPTPVVSTTPRPVEVSYPTPTPTLFTKAPPTLIHTPTPPVRNPFETITRAPPKNLFVPSTEPPHIEPPHTENVPQFPNVEQIRPELISPPTPPAPEIQQPTPDYNPTLNNFDPSKIYISNLGELSTDPGSNFDPKTAIILPDKSQEQSPVFEQAGNQEHLLHGQTDPPQNNANKNLLLNLENIASSIPGNINSQLALLRDQPLVEGGYVQIPGTLHVSLNYTQRINTALKNVLIPSEAQDQLAVNPLLSGDGKLVSEIYGQNKLHPTNGILKFAHNINSAFEVNNPALGLNSHETRSFLNSAGQQSTSFGDFGGTDGGASFSTINTPYGSDGKPKIQSVTPAPGQPTSVQGFGFTKSNLAVSTPASVLHTQTIYIPSINLKQNPSLEKTADVTGTSEPHLLPDQVSDTLHNIHEQQQQHNDQLGQDQDQLTAAAQHYGSDLERLRQNGLGDSRNHAKRAENLLVKGVQLSIYDATKSDSFGDNDNAIDNTDYTPEPTTEGTDVTTTIKLSTVSEPQDIDDLLGLEELSTTTEDALATPVTSNGGTAFVKRITNRGRRLQSTTHIIQHKSSHPNGSSNGLKFNSPYINLPDTKVSIAKSIEEGFFSVSNYPLPSNPNQAMSFSSIFPGVILHPGTPFQLKENPNIVISNAHSPFSTISPFNKSEEATEAPTTSKPSPFSLARSRGGPSVTTPIPSLTSIPLSSHTAQRRSDDLSGDDDEEGSFFKGVSSYHVPLNSVGRLPADIKGTRKR